MTTLSNVARAYKDQHSPRARYLAAKPYNVSREALDDNGISQPQTLKAVALAIIKDILFSYKIRSGQYCIS